MNQTQTAPRTGALEAGERTDQKTFHAWYKATATDFKAELIDGEVVVSSPMKVGHGEYHSFVMGWLFSYSAETPGTRPRDNTTTIINNECEPQPDGALVVEPGRGGQTGVGDDGYATGAPELVAEIANSSGSIDLHRKKDDYERAGVKEYVVVLVRNQQVRWFVRQGDGFLDVPPDADGVFRSRVFPGLWLDPKALLTLDGKALLETLRRGLASPEHAAFVARLQAQAP